jgi:hypothetical protein
VKASPYAKLVLRFETTNKFFFEKPIILLGTGNNKALVSDSHMGFCEEKAGPNQPSYYLYLLSSVHQHFYRQRHAFVNPLVCRLVLRSSHPPHSPAAPTRKTPAHGGGGARRLAVPPARFRALPRAPRCGFRCRPQETRCRR